MPIKLNITNKKKLNNLILIKFISFYRYIPIPLYYAIKIVKKRKNSKTYNYNNEIFIGIIPRPYTIQGINTT